MHEAKGKKSVINKRRNCRTLYFIFFLYIILLYILAFLYRILATNISNINNSR